MKSKNLLPQIITGILSFALLVLGLLSAKLHLNSIPIKVMEKLGIYSGAGSFSYGISDNLFSANGTHEVFLSILKKLATNNSFSGLLPIIILGISLLAVLIFAISSATKSQYKWTTYMCAVLIPVVFCDFTNLVYLKTLFPHSLILILLLLICTIFINIYKREKVGTTGVLLLTLTTIAYSCMGNVQAITAIIFGLLIVRLCAIAHKKHVKILACIMGVVVIFQSIFFAYNFKSVDYKQSLYNSVFFGVCKYDSVTEIGLDPKLNDFKEVYYGMMENEQDYDLENSFYNKVSYPTLIKYYITHPANTLKLLNNQAKAAFYNHNDYSFTPYSKVKMLYIPTGLAVALVIAAVYIIIAMFVRKKYSSLKYVAEFLSALAIMWIISLIATVVSYGNCDITTNMYTFNVIFDILLVCGLTGGIRVMLAVNDEKKSKFGITHE